MALKDNINRIISAVIDKLDDPKVYQPKIIALQDSLVATIQNFNDARSDGKITANEIMEIAVDIMHALAKSKFIISLEKDEDKIDISISIMEFIYFDDDLLDNPNIPYIPDFIETKLEKMIFNLVIPGIFKGILKKYKKIKS